MEEMAGGNKGGRGNKLFEDEESRERRKKLVDTHLYHGRWRLRRKPRVTRERGVAF